MVLLERMLLSVTVSIHHNNNKKNPSKLFYLQEESGILDYNEYTEMLASDTEEP